MKQIDTDFQAGSQKVVYDQIDSTYPGGVHVDKVDATARFTDGIIPAGTALVPHTNGTFKVLNQALTAANLAGCIGLTGYDIKIDDFPLVSAITGATTRIDALPDLEKTGIALLSKALPKHTFY